MTKSPREDPLWYKDAVIYEVPVLSFFDADDDGYGDFEGLRQKLPYLTWLGIDTLWLLPFLESPLRDGGYDTSDFYRIHRLHGTRRDFEALLRDAHTHGLRVVMTLVLNHTSDQHPWFQEARDPTSPRHDWYVWSDAKERYGDLPILFSDTETSNWSFDRACRRYYWHRFFEHQPDLNFDNPAVRTAICDVVFYWLDAGVDGLRLEAVPYLYEHEGTGGVRSPRTIAFLRSLRSDVEARYGPGRLLWGEACTGSGDARSYFAGGRTVQMATNVALMPQLYLALCQEDRRKLVDTLEATADVPPSAQWALFLRNHDELSLSMLDEEDRAVMYDTYAGDACFRIHAGIRRRLAPMLGHERHRLELMHALLFSLPGTPVVYYGDEIGMADDPFLGDRNGVRTAMQWSPDKHGGFSRAPYHRLFLPVIARPPYGYQTVNVEQAKQNPHSLLHAVRRMIELRRQHVRAFGRGTARVVPLDEPSVLAFLRSYEDEHILVVANLSRFTRSVFLPDTPLLRGRVPVDLFGGAALPPFTGVPYHLLLGPHRFHWFRLAAP